MNDLGKINTGFRMLENGLYKESISKLIDERNKYSKILNGKIERYLGIAFYVCEKYAESKISLQNGKTFEDIESSLWLELLFPDTAEIIIDNNLIFNFVGKFTKLEKRIFILKNIKMYSYLSKAIDNFYKFDKKINIYIYENRIDSIGNSLSYSNNFMLTIHTNLYDVYGHEMAHVIFNNIHQNSNKNTFIDEGIAVFFDRILSFEEYMSKNNNNIKKFDVKELWKDFNCDTHYTTLDKYYFSGAFVGYVIKIIGIDTFLEFIKDESLENAMIFFGQKLNEIINNFYNVLNEYGVN